MKVRAARLAGRGLAAGRRRVTAVCAVASEPGMLPLTALAGGAALTVFIALAPLLLPCLSIPYRSTSGIFSWAASAQYPIHEQSAYFALALIALPVIIFLFWGIWVGMAAAAGGAPSRALRWSVLAFLPLFAWWRKIPVLDVTAWPGMVGVLWLTAALMVLIPLVIRVTNRFWPGIPAAVPAPAAAPAVGLPPPLPALHRTSPTGRGLRLARCVLVWFLLPCAIYLVVHAARREPYMDAFHEGERLAPANQMLHGGVPYRDIYCQHGLLRNAIVPWLAVKTFGVSRDSVIHGEHLIIPLFFVACYFLGLQVFRLGAPMALALVVLTAGLWLHNLPDFYNGMAGRQLFAVVAIALVAGAVRGPRGFALLDPVQTPVAAGGGGQPFSRSVWPGANGWRRPEFVPPWRFGTPWTWGFMPVPSWGRCWRWRGRCRPAFRVGGDRCPWRVSPSARSAGFGCSAPVCFGGARSRRSLTT